MDLESCFINPSTQEETTDERIASSNLSQVATASPTRTNNNVMKTTGNSPVAATAASSISAAVSAPGTALIAAAYQNSAVHTPAQTTRFDKKSVEMEAVIRAIEKIIPEEQTKIDLTKRLIELMKPT